MKQRAILFVISRLYPTPTTKHFIDLLFGLLSYNALGRKRSGRFLTASAPMDSFTPNPYKEIVPGPTYVRPTEVSPKIVGPNRFYVPFPKKPGGNHSGCFDKFPSYASNPYDENKEKKSVEGVFVSGGPPLRTKYTNSIIDQVTRIACNGTNYIHYQEQVYPLKI